MYQSPCPIPRITTEESVVHHQVFCGLCSCSTTETERDATPLDIHQKQAGLQAHAQVTLQMDSALYVVLLHKATTNRCGQQDRTTHRRELSRATTPKPLPVSTWMCTTISTRRFGDFVLLCNAQKRMHHNDHSQCAFLQLMLLMACILHEPLGLSCTCAKLQSSTWSCAL